MKLFSTKSLERREWVLLCSASRRKRYQILVFAFLLIAISGCANSGFVVQLTAENRKKIDRTLVVVNADIRGYGEYEYYARPSESGTARIAENIGFKQLKFGTVSYPWGLHEIDYNTSFSSLGNRHNKWNTESLKLFYGRAFTSLRHTLESFPGAWTPEEMATCVVDSLKSGFSICGSVPNSLIQTSAIPVAEVTPLPLLELCLPLANEYNANTVLVVNIEYEMKHQGQVIQSWPRVNAALIDMDNQVTLYRRLIRGNGIWLRCDTSGFVRSGEVRKAKKQAEYSATFLEAAINQIVIDLR